MAIKKLIEVALPLEKINEAAAKEKTIRHGHPANLHMYWARRPLAAARAVIWSSLVDDPSSHPEEFPTEEAQNKERQRLFEILEKIVQWDNLNNAAVLESARKEINRYTNNNPPALLDPFAGGGAIPFEAQRMGLVAYAHDLNPVAIMINKAMIDLPFRFGNVAPINPESRKKTDYNKKWSGLDGLAEDVLYYGKWIGKEAQKRIGMLYPKLKVAGSNDVSVISWLWTRTVKCPNPACGCDAPLIKNFIISKKKGKEVWVEPKYRQNKLYFDLHTEGSPATEGSINRKGAVCSLCKSPIGFEYIREECKQGRMKSVMMAIVGEGKNTRIYAPANDEHIKASLVEKPQNAPQEELAYYPGHLNTNIYGLNTFDKLFTNRQLVSLTTFCELLAEVRNVVQRDAAECNFRENGVKLCENGMGRIAYGEAIAIYLAFCFDKMVDLSNALNRWEPNAQCPRQVFARQAIPMIWDYAECNLFSSSSGSWQQHLKNFMDCIKSEAFNFGRISRGIVDPFNAQEDCGLRNIMVSTDPPYYDNIGYADLSDFFYVWMRKSLQDIYPNVFKTMVTPKKEELISNQYRFEGDVDRAKSFFEQGMFETCQQIFKYSRDDIPVTIYYAYKQSESTENDNEIQVASSGWETMLSAIVNANFSITGTWPMKTECGSRSISQGSNALASSIVLVCRKRPADAPTTTRRNFIQELKRELRTSLQKLQSSNIAPVDMAQSAIGPGMGVFSKYTQVLEADGTPMSVRSALQIINQELDLYFNEQDGELDSNSRFCVDFYTQYGFNDAKFGDADTLARAKNTSVATLQSKGVFVAEKGVAHLVDRDKLPEKVDYADNMVWLFTQRLTRAMSTGGIKACATLIHNVHTSLPELAKALAYRLHSIAERKGWQDEAFAYNSLVIAWTDIQMAAANIHEHEKDQIEMDI